MRDTDTIMSANGSPLALPWKMKSFGTSGEQLTASTILEEDETPNGKGKEKAISLNSPPQDTGQQRIVSGVFSLRIGSESIELDPNLSPGKSEELTGLTNSAKKLVRDHVLKLAERWRVAK